MPPLACHSVWSGVCKGPHATGSKWRPRVQVIQGRPCHPITCKPLHYACSFLSFVYHEVAEHWKALVYHEVAEHWKALVPQSLTFSPESNECTEIQPCWAPRLQKETHMYLCV